MKNRKHDIERYLRGELSSAEMHALEKEALNDPFLAEALEGVDHAGADNFLYDLHRLNRSVHDRTRSRKNKTIRMWGWTAGIAATVLLIAVSGFLVISLLKDQRARQLAIGTQTSEMKGSKPLPPTDSLTVNSGKESREEKRDTPATSAPQPGVGETKRKQVSPETGPATADAGGKQADVAAAENLLAQEKPAEEPVGKSEQRVTGAEIKSDDIESDETDVAARESGLAVTQEQTKAAEEVRANKRASRALDGRAAGVESRNHAPAASLPPESMEIKGKVSSAGDGEGLPGVNVVVKGTSIGTSTDAGGNFQLTLPPDNNTLVFSFIGFESKELQLASPGDVNVVLQEDAASLSEVVVTGQSFDGGARETPTYRGAEPNAGRTAFKDYLVRSIIYPPEALKNKIQGRVTVRFTVEPNGQLTGFEVVRGIGFGCEEELIRSIRQGPSWTPGMQGDRPVRDKVKVRYTFELPR
jgi:TonB family protein